MNRQRQQKLNYLLQSWPKGTVAVSRWLKKQGVSRQLARGYEKTDWIKSIGYGAFKRSGESINWAGGLYALQKQLNLNVYLGGRSALELQGYMHFVPSGQTHPVFLFGLKRSLPAWFKKYQWKQPVKYTYTNCFPYKDKVGLTERDMGEFSIIFSSSELAIMEVLYLIDKGETYGHTFLLMEGLKTLRPAVVQKLLEKTSSIKVKRLFLHFAEKFNHPWMKYLNLEKVDLGKGKRVIGKGGRFDPKYNISVPKESI